MFPKTLIIGAKTAVGSELVQRLLHLGIPLRVASDTMPNRDYLVQYPSLEYCTLDFSNKETVKSALNNVKSILFIPHSVPSVVTNVKDLIGVARMQGIGHLVFLSIIGADSSDQGIAHFYHDAEKLVESSEIPFTILEINCLMQYFIPFLQLKSSTIRLPLSDARVSFIDARDVAVVGADIVIAASMHLGKTYQLTGPSAITMFEVAEAFSEVFGKPVGYVSVALDTAAYEMGDKIPPLQIDSMLEYFEFLGRGAGAVVSDCVEKIARIRPFTFIDFFRDYAEVIRKGS